MRELPIQHLVEQLFSAINSAADLSAGRAFEKWGSAHRDTDEASKEDLNLAQENDLLRRDDRILKKAGAIIKFDR